jgi:hypothetical protein
MFVTVKVLIQMSHANAWSLKVPNAWYLGLHQAGQPGRGRTLCHALLAAPAAAGLRAHAALRVATAGIQGSEAV